VVAGVRGVLPFWTHYFPGGQAVNANGNTVPTPNWRFLEDAGGDGHFLTTTGTPPSCNTTACTNANYTCTPDGCGAGQDCCLPNKDTWQNMPGFEVATQPASSEVKVLRPDVPYNQFDGAFGTTNGSEPAYNLSQYLGNMYKNSREVTLLTGMNGPENQDIWMSGYLDGCNDIILGPGGANRAAGCEGKISYLGGHSYATTVPVTSGSEGQGVRLFLNALFEAQCTTAPGGGGGTGTDTDGDGVNDGSDPYPDDPTKCGDLDGDGAADCASGAYDPANDCDAMNPDNGSKDGGCCDTGSSGRSVPTALLGLLAGMLVLGRRKRPRRA